MLLNRQGSKPLHKQLEEIILQNLENEVWKPNTRIPSESELSREYGVSRMTIRVTLERLVSNGLLYRVPGKGTFVASEKIESQPLVQLGIREQLEQRGYETHTHVLSVNKIMPDTMVCKHLQISDQEKVFQIHSLRFVKKAPFSIHTSYIPCKSCPDIQKQNLEDMQLCDIIEKVYGHPIMRRVETLEAVSALPEEASLLELDTFHPLLMLENDVYTLNDQPIEYNKVLFRGDRIKLRLEYNKEQNASLLPCL